MKWAESALNGWPCLKYAGNETTKVRKNEFEPVKFLVPKPGDKLRYFSVKSHGYFSPQHKNEIFKTNNFEEQKNTLILLRLEATSLRKENAALKKKV